MIFRKKKAGQKEIDKERMPTHIAFIMDGNGRYATSRGMPRTFGHRQGLEALKKVIEESYNLGIKVLSFFMFSTENWKRPKEEVDYIFSLANEFKKDAKDDYIEKGIKVVTMGDLTKLPKDLQENLAELVNETKYNNKMIINLGLNYGGRDEIIGACNQIIADGHKNVDKDVFKAYLYTKDLPDPDIVVRTSGEMRVSNFMLYQLAYSEFIFPKKHWPEFGKKDLEDVIIEYQSRDRRFGGLKS